MCDDLSMPKKHDPGGKVRIARTLDVKTKAVFGGAGDCYRYRLSRTWDEKKPHALFVMMNPSTADPQVDDPTVAKCGRFARSWGIWRHSRRQYIRLPGDPKEASAHSLRPSAPTTTSTSSLWAKASDIVVFAYGQPGHRALAQRGQQVARLLIEKTGVTPHVLKLSKHGIPTHPLYLLESLEPVVWRL
jgi:hypothetical protein